MQTRDHDRRIHIAPPAGAKPPERQPVEARCEDCWCVLSRYRGPWETRCQTCQRSHGNVAVLLEGLCLSCGKDEHVNPDSSWCFPCELEAEGKRACRCESCGRWYGFKIGTKSSHTSTCSTCRSRTQTERFIAVHGVHPSTVEGRVIRGLPARKPGRKVGGNA